jgi:hypothetical protein
MICAHCHTDPGKKKHNSLWLGFRDGDTGQYVCNGCRRAHYRFKFLNKELNGLFSEFPVMIPNPQLTINYGQPRTS